MERKGRALHLTQQESMLRVEGLKKVFRSGASELVLFENLSFEVKRGEMVANRGRVRSREEYLVAHPERS